MVFAAPYFLFFYLPVSLGLYFFTPTRWRNLALLGLNLVFYGFGEPKYILLLCASTLVDYVCGRWVSACRDRGRERGAKAGVGVSLAFNLGILGLFKYWDLLASTLGLPLLGLPLPIGISFYTFQTMSYTIDVYRGQAQAQKNFCAFAAYVTLFPQLIAGPIVRYRDVARQLEVRDCSAVPFAAGARRFVVGLSKKALLANQLGLLWESCSGGSLTPLSAWLGAAALGLQIYFDFSGYSDMAIGLGKMLGFDFLENFNYPFTARSITDFWRRWHISLSSWFRDYVYFPLGGSRRGRGRTVFNLLLVWSITGLWHGAGWNFLLWGAYFGVLLAAEKLLLGRALEKLPRWLQHGYTLVLLGFSWPIFGLEDLGALGAYLKAMLGLSGRGWDGAALYYLASYLPLLVIGCAAALPAGKRLWDALPLRAGQTLCPLLMLGGLILSTAYLVDGTYNPFLYFRF